MVIFNDRRPVPNLRSPAVKRPLLHSITSAASTAQVSPGLDITGINPKNYDLLNGLLTAIPAGVYFLTMTRSGEQTRGAVNLKNAGIEEIVSVVKKKGPQPRRGESQTHTEERVPVKALVIKKSNGENIEVKMKDLSAIKLEKLEENDTRYPEKWKTTLQNDNARTLAQAPGTTPRLASQGTVSLDTKNID